jgi:hypothetical protein
MENISIEVWARQIREIKIRELKELINKKQEIVDGLRNANDSRTVILRLGHYIEVSKLKNKLDFLLNLE